MGDTLVELTSCIQALDLQSLLCEAGVHMVRPNRGPQSLTPTSTAPQAACQCGHAKGEAPTATEGQLCPQALLPGLLAAWALCLGWRLAAGQPSAHSPALPEGCWLAQSGLYEGIATGWGLSVRREV